MPGKFRLFLRVASGTIIALRKALAANLGAGATAREPALNATLMLLCTVMAEPRGLRHYLRTHFLDTTFRGLYHANAFDLALLVPYFIVLILLAFYGMHRYQLVYLYFKHRKNKTTDPPSRFAELPKVTIQLPIFNEQYVIDRLVECVCKM